MNKPEITQAILTADGQVLKKNPDGTFTLLKGETDLERVENMTDEEITAIAQADPDNPEWTEEDWDRMTTHPIHHSTVTVDDDIVQWFHLFKGNAQQQINTVLRNYIHQHSNTSVKA